MHFKKIRIAAAATATSLLLLTVLASQSAAQMNSWNTAVQPQNAAQSAANTQGVPGTAQTAAPPEPSAIKAQAPQTGANSVLTHPATEDETYQAAFGFNYPGANIRIFLSGGFAAELKGQYIDKVGVGGLRLYFFNGAPKKGDQLKFFGGVELDAITFKGDLSKGAGVAVEAFMGTEVFVLKNVAVQVDMGPAYISITDGDTSLNSNGLEFVVNSGVNFYF